MTMPSSPRNWGNITGLIKETHAMLRSARDVSALWGMGITDAPVTFMEEMSALKEEITTWQHEVAMQNTKTPYDNQDQSRWFMDQVGVDTQGITRE